MKIGLGRGGKIFCQVIFNEKIKESRLVIQDGKEILEIKTFPKEKMNFRKSFLLARQIIFWARQFGVKKIVLDWDKIEDFKFGESEEIAEIFAANFEMANYEFVRYKG